MTQKEIYQDLPEQIRKGNCVLLLGMGVYRGSSQITGGLSIPDNMALARELAERCGYAEEPLSLPRVAQYYEWKQGRQGLISYVRDRFEPFIDMHLPVLGIICRFPFKAIITTCVDNLLENEFLRQGKRYDKIVCNDDVPFQHSDRPLLIKLHGTLDRPDSLVLTEDDQDKFFERLPNVSDTVKTLCSHCTLVFLGFDLEDQNFKRLHGEITTKIAKFAPRAYAFDGRFSDFIVQWWKRRNVAIIQVEAAELLAELEGMVLQRPRIDLKYNDFQDACRFQIGQQLAEVRRTKYDRALYVPRDEIEGHLKDFISSDKNGLILVGDSGTGKTNTLCHLAKKWDEDGHLVLYYDCGGSLGIDVEKAIIRVLAPEENVPFDALIEQVASTARAQAKRVIWFFDGINEFRDGENRAGELLKRLDAIVERARTPDLKLILTCRTGTWENLEMLGRPIQFWNKYYPGPEQTVSLPRFAENEFEEAYRRYQEQYKITSSLDDLSRRTQERLHDPLLLRMTAVAYEGKSVPGDALSIKVLHDYCERHIGRRIRGRQFLRRLATVLLEQGTQAIALSQILEDPQLSRDVSDDPDSAFQRLKDSGILTEMGGETNPVIKFAFDRFLEYFIALCWIDQVGDRAQLGRHLVKILPNYGQYAPAWSAARIAVAVSHAEEKEEEQMGGKIEKATKENLLPFASSRDYQNRQLAVVSLVELHAEDPKGVEDILQSLIEVEAVVDEAAILRLRTALKAARMIGGEVASGIFLQAAASPAELQSDIVAMELYALWQQDPDRGYTILEEIVSSIDFPILWQQNVESGFKILNEIFSNIGAISKMKEEKLAKPLRFLNFAALFSFGLFVNNCHRRDVVEQISDVWWIQFEEKYDVPRALESPVKHFIKPAILLMARGGVAEMAVNMFTLGGAIPLDDYLSNSDDDTRERALRLNDYLDPSRDITKEKVLKDIYALLESDWGYLNILASFTLAVHTFKDFELMKPHLDDLLENLPERSLLWLLLVFVLLSPVDGPADSLLEFVESLTERIQSSNRDDFIQGPYIRGTGNLFERIDFALLPLGLAYGRQGKEMRLFSQMLEEAFPDDLEMLNRYIRGLAPVGFYYPRAILDLLTPVASQALTEPRLRNSLVETLATMGVIHHEEVEHFLKKMRADDKFIAHVQARADVSLVKHYVNFIGVFNAIVYGGMFYPRIRDFVKDCTLAFNQCKNMQRLLADIAHAYVGLLRKSDYRISNVIES